MYRLLGENVSHSYSSEIYKYLGYEYGIMDLREDKFENFMRNRIFSGLNITMPYKELVVKHLDHLDSIAEETGVVNTVVKKDGELYGYNNDFFGLKYLITNNKIDIKDKKVLILGSGATSKTAAAVCRHLEADQIVKVSRTEGKDAITYNDLESVTDFEVIINTTPIGMYPNVDEELLDLSIFNNLEAVVDVIYNPISTNLILDAKEMGIQAVGGFEMLIAQAIESARLFFDEDLSDDLIDEIYQKKVLEKSNIVLIGMPTAGKTTIGRKLAEKLNKEFLDVDYILVEEEGRTIQEIFTNDGEDYFRMLEAATVSKLANLNTSIIATGGGTILDENNVKRLKRNGLLVFINRPLDLLYPDKSRPLTASEDSLEKIFEDRYDVYKSVADIEVVNDKSADLVVNEILEALKCAY